LSKAKFDTKSISERAIPEHMSNLLKTAHTVAELLECENFHMEDFMEDFILNFDPVLTEVNSDLNICAKSHKNQIYTCVKSETNDH